jgi:hypothetical protein
MDGTTPVMDGCLNADAPCHHLPLLLNVRATNTLSGPESLVPPTLHEHACDSKYDWEKGERVGQKCDPMDRHIRTFELKYETSKTRLSLRTRRNTRGKHSHAL